MSTETVNAIATIVEANPALVLVDDKKFEDFYEHVNAEANATPVDLSTDKGRRAIASMAHKIARTKTAIDDAGKKLNEESRERADAEAKERIAAAERAAKEAEEAAARKIEEERQARELEKAEQERIEREAREADAARQADREHRAKIMGAAKAAIIEIGIDEPKAKEIVLAIAAGNVPHVTIRF